MTFSKGQDLIQDLVCDFCFWSFVQLQLMSVARQDRHNVGIAVESCTGLRDIVRNQQIEGLVLQLFLAVLEYRFSFRRKTYQDTVSLLCSQFLQNIRVGDKLQKQGLPVLLDLLERRGPGLEVRNGRSLYDDACFLQVG